jgi:hypothetical protein
MFDPHVPPVPDVRPRLGDDLRTERSHAEAVAHADVAAVQATACYAVASAEASGEASITAAERKVRRSWRPSRPRLTPTAWGRRAEGATRWTGDAGGGAGM